MGTPCTNLFTRMWPQRQESPSLTSSQAPHSSGAPSSPGLAFVHAQPKVVTQRCFPRGRILQEGREDRGLRVKREPCIWAGDSPYPKFRSATFQLRDLEALSPGSCLWSGRDSAGPGSWWALAGIGEASVVHSNKHWPAGGGSPCCTWRVWWQIPPWLPSGAGRGQVAEGQLWSQVVPELPFLPCRSANRAPGSASGPQASRPGTGSGGNGPPGVLLSGPLILSAVILPRHT